MDLPIVVKIIIYDYTVHTFHTFPKKLNILDNTDINTPDDYLKVLFGKDYANFTYLNRLHVNVYNNRVRYLSTCDCKEIELCNNLTGLILKGNSNCTLPESLTELCCTIEYSPKKLPNNLRILSASFDDESVTYLPDTIEILCLYHHPLPLTKLPKNLKILILPSDFTFQLPYDIFENISLKYLTLGNSFNHPIQIHLDMLSSSLEYLHFGYMFNQEIELDKLVLLKHLEFGSSFNQVVQLDKLVLLEKLTFGYAFNQIVQLDKLVLLKRLEFGFKFNQTVQLDKLVLLKRLEFGFEFNQTVQLDKLVLLENLTFRDAFDQLVQLNKLTLLKYLKFGDNFNQPLMNEPVTVITGVNIQNNRAIINILFSIARHILFPWTLPSHINIFSILYDILLSCLMATEHYNFFSICSLIGGFIGIAINNHTMPLQLNIHRHELLSSSVLASMIIGYVYIPKSMPSMNIHSVAYILEYWNITKKTSFAFWTVELIFKFLSRKINNYVSKRQTRLPPNAKKIIFGFRFDQPLSVGMIPDSVEELIFGDFFDKPLAEDIITGKWAENRFGQLINSIFSIKYLPQNIKKLVFGNRYNHRIYNHHLPDKLTHIVVSSQYAHIEKLREICNRRNIRLHVRNEIE